MSGFLSAVTFHGVLGQFCTKDCPNSWHCTLAICCKHRMTLKSRAHYNRRCNSWKPNAYCKAKPDWMAEPAAEIVGGNPEFL